MTERARGMATLDAMIALAVLGMIVGALAPIAFGDQSLGADSRLRREATLLAEQALARARAGAWDDFGAVLPYQASNGAFRVALEVTQVDRHAERVTAEVSWSVSGRHKHVRLETLFTDRELEETCDPLPAGDWTRPHATTYALADLAGDPAGAYPITGIDAYDGRLYVTASNGATAQPTLFVLALSASGPPMLLGKADNDPAANTGPAAISVVPQGGKVYAFLASASSFSRGQLQVVDVTSPAPSGWKPTFSTFKIPSSAVPAAGLGNAIAYRRGTVYLGLAASPGGDEFDLFDAADPTHPVWRSGYPLGGHAVNGIAVRGKYAFVAHPAAAGDAHREQLTVLRVDDQSAPARVSGFYFDGGIGGNGKSVFVSGTRLFLGRTASRISGATDAIPELFSLDATRPDALPAMPAAGAALATPESVNALIVRGDLAFALTSSQFQVWDFGASGASTGGGAPSVPQPFTPQASAAEFAALPGKGVAMDCEGDEMYAASMSAAGAGFITVFTPS